MDSGEGRNAGDIVSAKKASASEEYYRYMLLKEKLKSQKDNADPLLTVQSEREVIELNILRNLINITESSPEFSQIVDITGSRDRYEQARILSEVVYDKVRAEAILSFYTPSRNVLLGHFLGRTDAAADVRAAGAASLNSQATLGALDRTGRSATGGLAQLLAGGGGTTRT